MRKWLFTIGGFLALQNFSLAVQETVFDYNALISTPLNPRTLKTTENNGIVTEEVMFHSEKDGDKDIEIFALFSYPKDGKMLPAYVWNQGGLGQATTHWTERGAKRGYAVLCIDFPMPGYRSTGDYPIVSGLELGDDPRKAPIYHGTVALLKAVSYLESRPEVDKNRIGMAGMSWGGFYTTLMVGLDPRLKVGSSMFGTGSLHLGNIWWDGQGWDTKRDKAFRERWRQTLDPAWRLQDRKVPLAWITGTNDWFYWMPALMQSYQMAAGRKHLSLLPNWDHSFTGNFGTQTFAWLDVHLKGEPEFIKVTPLKVAKQGRNLIAQWNFSGPRKVVSANLMFSYGDWGNWTSRYWSTLKAEIKGNTCTVTLPSSPLPYYIGGMVIDTDDFYYSTPLLRINPADFKLKGRSALLDYDGCSEWGGFERSHISYLLGHGYPAPSVSEDAREGTQSAILKVGKTTIYPIYFTVGIPHRFTAYLKADKPVQVTVELSGQFNGKPTTQEQKFQIATEWTPVSMDFTPPSDILSVRFGANFTVPEGATVLADSVSFRPIQQARG
ncbi:hypothetical protein BH18ACI4_BH18ACI4_28730 [soil metagenome]